MYRRLLECGSHAAALLAGSHASRSSWIPLCICLLVAVLPPLSAQNADTKVDPIVAEALQGFLLGNPEDIHVVARTRAPEGLAENVESLALAAERPVPRLKEKQERLKEYGSDQLTENLDRLIRRIEPRQRFLEARHDRRYEKWRRLYNSITSPVLSVFQGQFFPLFSLPFDAIDYVVDKRVFLTPEGRRELYTARGAAAFPEADPIARRARNLIDDWQSRRTRLAVIQAEQNGQRALENENLNTADFWFRREMELQNWTEPKRSDHLKIGTRRARRTAHRSQSNVVADGDLLFYSPAEFNVYTSILRDLILNDSEAMVDSIGILLVDYAPSAVIDDALAARAAVERRTGDNSLARVYLRDLPEDKPDTPWSSRAQLYSERMEFDPEPLLEETFVQSRERYWDYLLHGENPTIVDRAFTAEEARLRRRAWVSRAQALFIFDAISRAMALPFIGSFPKPEFLDAAARVDDSWWNTPEGRPWLETVMKAQAAAKQYQDAAESARQLNDPVKAAELEQKAARYLERLGDSESARARERVLVYERLLNAYPSYRHSRRVEEKLAEALVDSETRIRVDKEELLAYPELWKDRGLRLDPALLDKSTDNGEISEEGVAILSYDAMAYEDRATGRRLEVPMSPEDHEAVLRMLEPRRRSQALREELRKPLPRRKVPISIEAGVLPGFDVRPGLVPLDPDPAQRELYE